MSKPDSNSSKVLISNPVIGFIIVTLIAGSLLYIYAIHHHVTHLQLYRSAIAKMVKANKRDKKSMRDRYLKFNHGLHTLSQASEEFLQTSLENQALSQYTDCQSETNKLWELISTAVDSQSARIHSLTWNSSELEFELRTHNEDKLFDRLNRTKSAYPGFGLHIDQVSHSDNEIDQEAVVFGRVNHEQCTGGQL